MTNRFDIEAEQLTDGSFHLVVYKKGFRSKKIGAFSGNVDEVMSKAARSIKGELKLDARRIEESDQ